MRYIPNSPEERKQMLGEIGLSDIEELFRGIPQHLKLKTPLNIPGPIPEPELIACFRNLAKENLAAEYISFLGAGAYSHFIPVIVDALISRSEFYTAYTPYQPELSQGTLQAIFEFQTMICQLTGMEVANASLYDGSTALAEAVLMAQRITRRKRVIIASSVHPEYQAVVGSYIRNMGITLGSAPFTDTGTVDIRAISADSETAAIVVQSPNFFGCIEDLESIAGLAHSVGALFIVSVTEPISLGLLKSPGEAGADIVCGEGQSFGVPINYGGPYLGFFASLEKHARQMPGRLIGQAYDSRGQRGFVITLATREQHIRREKATSNICTNQGLCALMATVYLATMGRSGLQEVAMQNLQKAAYAAEMIQSLDGFKLRFSGPRFNEFVIKAPRPASQILRRLLDEKIIGGVDLGQYYAQLSDCLLVCVTETATRENIDRLVEALRNA